MPDPRVAVPVKAQQRGGRFVLVDANGKRLDGQGSFPDRARAQKAAAVINVAWSEVKKERKAKGAPAITEGIIAGRVGRHARVIYWQESLHPRDRLGKFVNVLDALKKMPLGSSVRLPGGEYVTWKYGKYRLHEKGGKLTRKVFRAEHAATMMAGQVKLPSPRWNFERLDEPKSLVPLASRRAWGLD